MARSKKSVSCRHRRRVESAFPSRVIRADVPRFYPEAEELCGRSCSSCLCQLDCWGWGHFGQQRPSVARPVRYLLYPADAAHCAQVSSQIHGQRQQALPALRLLCSRAGRRWSVPEDRASGHVHCSYWISTAARRLRRADAQVVRRAPPASRRKVSEPAAESASTLRSDAARSPAAMNSDFLRPVR
jgi:hypothetical protein